MSQNKFYVRVTRNAVSGDVSGTPINDVCLRDPGSGCEGFTGSDGIVVVSISGTTLSVRGTRSGFTTSNIVTGNISGEIPSCYPVIFSLSKQDKIGTATEHQFNSGGKFTFTPTVSSQNYNTYCPPRYMMILGGGKSYYRLSTSDNKGTRCPRISELDAKNTGEIMLLVSGSTGATQVISSVTDPTMNITSMMYSSQRSLYPTKIFTGFTTGITFGTGSTYNSVKFGVSGSSFTYGAFEGCTGILNASVFCGSKSLPNRMFSGCTNLDFVDIDSTCDGIYASAFTKCSKLEYIYFGHTYDGSNNVNTIGDVAFSGCTSLRYLYVPNVTTIGSNAFSGCTKLTTINGNTSTVIPTGVTSLGAGAFRNCTSITSVTIPSTITEIPGTCFFRCTSLKKVVIEGDLNSIGTSAFSGCTSLTSVTFNGNVVSVGNYAFSGCISLSDINTENIVSSYGMSSFKDCTSLTSVTINSGVTSVFTSVFYGCTSITDAYVYGKIGTGMFSGCASLTGVTFSGQTNIPSNAFLNCNLSNFTLPDTLTSIGTSAFTNNVNLTDVVIPSGVTSLSGHTFSGCTSLKYIVFLGDPSGVTLVTDALSGLSTTANGNVFVPISASTTTLGTSAASLSSVIPGAWTIRQMIRGYYGYLNNYTNVLSTSGYTYINDAHGLGYFVGGSTKRYSDYRCQNKEMGVMVDIPMNTQVSSVPSIKEYAFKSCHALSIEIPSFITRIEQYAFNSSELLSNVTINASTLALLGNSAFRDCTQITELTLPQTTSIGSDVFRCDTDVSISYAAYTSRLTKITYNGTSFPTASTTTFEGIARYGTLYHPNISSATAWLSTSQYYLGYYKWVSYLDNYDTFTYSATSTSTATKILNATTNFSGTTMIIDDTTSVSLSTGYTFSSTGFHTVKILSNTSTKAIPASGLASCTYLVSVNLSKNTTIINSDSFGFCSKLKSINLDGVNTIGTYAFQYCYKLASANFSSGITKLNNYSFRNCYSLGSITIPDNVKTLGTNVFDACSGATSLSIGTGITTIGSYDFRHCSGLTSIVIPSNITTINTQAFRYCRNVTSINIPNTVKTLGTYCFADITGATNLNIGTGVSTIQTACFSGLTSLTGFTLPDSVTSLTASAFCGCSNLVYIKAKRSTAPTISADTFYLVHTGGTLDYDTDSTGAYASTWLSTGNYYLGSYGWNDANGAKIHTTFSATTTGTEMNILNPSASLDGIKKIKIYSGSTVYGTYNSGDASFGRTYTPTVSGIISIDFYCDSTLTTLPSFNNCEKLITVTIPSQITSLCENNFRYCGNMTTVSFDDPDNITSIPNNSFMGCFFLNSINLDITSVSNIGDNAFNECMGIDFGDVTFDDTLVSIGVYAFYNCRFNSITFNSPSITSIPDNCFTYVSNYDVDIIKATLDIGTYITSIGDNAFAYSDVQFSDNMKLNDSDMDKKGQGYYDLSQITSFGERCFIDCDYLGNIILPLGTGITYGQQCFYEYTSSIASGYKKATEHVVFRYMYNTRSSSTFEGTYSVAFKFDELIDYYLENDYFEASTTGSYRGAGITAYDDVDKYPSMYPSTLFNYNNISDVTFYIPVLAKTNSSTYSNVWEEYGWDVVYYPATYVYYQDGTVKIVSASGTLNSSDVESQNENKSLASSVIVSVSIDTIGSCCFRSFSQLSSVTLPTTVTTIKTNSFSYCANLPSITLPNSVTSIGDYSFSWCTNLTSITLSTSLTTIGEYAFEDCYNLTGITIPNSVRNIGSGAFYGCGSIKSIVIPNYVTTIEYSTFHSCTNLTSVTIPNTVTSIKGYAFYNTYLTGITIPTSVTRIDDCAFMYSSLQNISIPTSITSISVETFSNCTSLTSVTIPNTVTSIGNSAFIFCSSLTNVTIPNSVTSIGTYTFANCTNLTSVTIPTSVTIIDNAAFEHCTSLTSITLPTSLTTIGDYLFRYCENLTRVNYGGTMSQFNSKCNTGGWNNCHATIYCSDGNITL